MTGKALLRWPKSRFKEICGGNLLLGETLFDALHKKAKEADREWQAARKKQREAINRKKG